MRTIHLVPAAFIAPFVMLHLTRTITGEPLSAVILTLLMFILVTAMVTSAASSGRQGARP